MDIMIPRLSKEKTNAGGTLLLILWKLKLRISFAAVDHFWDIKCFDSTFHVLEDEKFLIKRKLGRPKVG